MEGGALAVRECVVGVLGRDKETLGKGASALSADLSGAALAFSEA